MLIFISSCTTTPAQVTSGISGKVMIGPTCPVVRPDMADQCKDKPHQANVIVKDSQGKEITRFSSDANGEFKVALKPGTYHLDPQSPNMLPRGKPQDVVVEDGKYTDILISYDSGIR